MGAETEGQAEQKRGEAETRMAGEKRLPCYGCGHHTWASEDGRSETGAEEDWSRGDCGHDRAMKRKQREAE